MEGNTPAHETVDAKVEQMAMSVEHPFLLQFDFESIMVCFRKYDE